MIQFSKPRKAYNPDERFFNGQAHAIDAREMFARPPLASASRRMNNQYTPDYSSSSSRYTSSGTGQLGAGSQAPFTQDLSQSSYVGGRKGKSNGVSSANNASGSRAITQNTYSSQASIGISQSDRIHGGSGLGHGMSSMMSQESMGYLDDYKSQQDDYLSQDSFAPNGFQSQGFTQY
ncbi:hypothetical protein BGX20_006518 [Mortierella sp. AD010]|nr:hypothetical protein BGX20_006518 [Mortierella sp. AD010]